MRVGPKDFGIAALHAPGSASAPHFQWEDVYVQHHNIGFWVAVSGLRLFRCRADRNSSHGFWVTDLSDGEKPVATSAEIYFQNCNAYENEGDGFCFEHLADNYCFVGGGLHECQSAHNYGSGLRTIGYIESVKMDGFSTSGNHMGYAPGHGDLTPGGYTRGRHNLHFALGRSTSVTNIASGFCIRNGELQGNELGIYPGDNIHFDDGGYVRECQIINTRFSCAGRTGIYMPYAERSSLIGNLITGGGLGEKDLRVAIYTGGIQNQLHFNTSRIDPEAKEGAAQEWAIRFANATDYSMMGGYYNGRKGAYTGKLPGGVTKIKGVVGLPDVNIWSA